MTTSLVDRRADPSVPAVALPHEKLQIRLSELPGGHVAPLLANDKATKWPELTFH